MTNYVLFDLLDAVSVDEFRRRTLAGNIRLSGNVGLNLSGRELPWSARPPDGDGITDILAAHQRVVQESVGKEVLAGTSLSDWF